MGTAVVWSVNKKGTAPWGPFFEADGIGAHHFPDMDSGTAGVSNAAHDVNIVPGQGAGQLFYPA